MSTSTSETGNAVNISNGKLMIDICTGFGDKYNPSNADITIANLTAKWTEAKTSDEGLSVAEQGIKEPVNKRAILFEPLRPLVTRVLSALESSKANDLVKQDAKGIADRIRGMIKTKKPATGAGADSIDSVSQSHQSFVQRADAFLDLVNLLKTVKEYKPNEAELTVDSLAALQGQMQVANDGIGAVLDTGDRAKLTRNRALYMPGTGLLSLAKLVKKYVKSVFGSTSAENRKVEGIRFRDLPKKERDAL